MSAFFKTFSRFTPWIKFQFHKTYKPVSNIPRGHEAQLMSCYLPSPTFSLGTGWYSIICQGPLSRFSCCRFLSRMPSFTTPSRSRLNSIFVFVHSFICPLHSSLRLWHCRVQPCVELACSSHSPFQSQTSNNHRNGWCWDCSQAEKENKSLQLMKPPTSKPCAGK